MNMLMGKSTMGMCRTLYIILAVNYQDLVSDTFNETFFVLCDFKRDQNKFRRGSLETNTGHVIKTYQFLTCV